MKTLLTFTAIIEALTGLALIVASSLLSEVLLGQTINETQGIIIAMVAGVALCSLAAGCWFLREDAAASGMVKALVCYNAGIVFIFVFSMLTTELRSIPFALVAFFHFGCAVWCGMILKN
ncbi:MAG: hypothetical protein H7259_00745 [Cytophagales bacterium]|nr:hypothetical protein [Cytophaga sp.]